MEMTATQPANRDFVQVEEVNEEEDSDEGIPISRLSMRKKNEPTFSSDHETAIQSASLNERMVSGQRTAQETLSEAISRRPEAASETAPKKQPVAEELTTLGKTAPKEIASEKEATTESAQMKKASESATPVEKELDRTAREPEIEQSDQINEGAQESTAPISEPDSTILKDAAHMAKTTATDPENDPREDKEKSIASDDEDDGLIEINEEIPEKLPITPAGTAESEEGVSTSNSISLDVKMALAEVEHFSEKANLSKDEKRKLFELLAYTRIRGTEFYKIFQAIDMNGREKLIQDEIKVLTNFKIEGFHTFIDEGAVWQKIEEYLVAAHPDIINQVPNRIASISELQTLYSEATTKLKEKAEEIFLLTKEKKVIDETQKLLAKDCDFWKATAEEEKKKWLEEKEIMLKEKKEMIREKERLLQEKGRACN